MAADLNIVEVTNQEPEFYRLVGPWLARREVARDLGAPLWDDDHVTWFVAIDAGLQLCGFAAADPRRQRVRLRSAYVRPEQRGRGVYRRLLAERLAVFGDRPLQATCTAASLPLLLSHGFEAVRSRGRYTEVRRG